MIQDSRYHESEHSANDTEGYVFFFTFVKKQILFIGGIDNILY